MVDRLLPGPVGFVHDALVGDGGALHSVGMGAGGRVWTWGSNARGQLGVDDMSIPFLRLPVELTSFPVPLSNSDWLTEDLDGDGLSNGEEALAGTDPANADTNGDGILDGAAVTSGLSATETDVDGDGLSNEAERLLGTDPFVPDTDGDGFDDALDAFPLDPSRQVLPPYDPSDTTPPTITLEEPESAVLIP